MLIDAKGGRVEAGQLLLGTFEIRREVARTTQGEVYEAFDVKLRRRVCIKVLPASTGHLVDDGNLYREARLASSLRSPHTIQVLYCGEMPSGVFFAMEWANGGSLADLLKERARLPASSVLEVLSEVGASLAEAHSLGLVHRDIKPANLLVCDIGAGNSVVKVADFGIATTLPEARQGVRAAGTPAYLAPEGWDGAVDVRTDIYALAVTAYELWSGQRPYEAASIGEYRTAHRDAPVPRIPCAHEHPALAAAIAAGMAKEPAERPPTVAALLDMAGTPASATGVFRAPALGDAPPIVVSALALGDTRSPQTATMTGTMTGGIDSETGTDKQSPLREQRLIALIAFESSPTELPIRDLGGVRLRAEADPGVEAMEIAAFGTVAFQVEPILAAWRIAEQLRSQGRAVAMDFRRVPIVPLRRQGELPKLEARRLRGLLRLAAGAELVLSQQAYSRLDSHYRAELAGRVEAATGQESTARRLLDAELAPRSKPRRLRTGRAATVGRAGELEQTSETIVDALDGSEILEFRIEGAAGIGKSRFLHDLRKRITDELDDVRWVSSSAYPEDVASERSVLRRLVREAFSLADGVSQNEATDSIRAQLAPLGLRTAPTIASDVAAFIAVDSGRTQDRASDRLGSSDGGTIQSLERSLADALRAMGRHGPVVWMLDDTQWADRESLDTIGRLLRRLDRSRFVWLRAARPTTQIGLGSQRRPRPDHRVETLSLGALRRSATVKLARQLLSRVDGDIEPLVSSIVEASQGIPLFCEELVRYLVARGSIQTDSGSGRWTLSPSADEESLALPDELEAIVGNRIALLQPAQQFALRAAAVLGRGFPRSAIEWVVGVEADAQSVEDALEELIELGLVEAESSAGAEMHYRIAHRLLEEAAYRSVVSEDRLRWHHRAALWLQGVAAAAPSFDRYALTAHHWTRADEPRRAADAHEQAGDLARASYADQEAYRQYGLASARLSDAEATPSARVVVHFKRARTAEFLALNEEALAEVSACLAAVESDDFAPIDERDSGWWWAAATCVRAILLGRKGSLNDAVECVEQAELRLSDTVEAPVFQRLRSQLANWKGWCLLRLGRAADAVVAYQSALGHLADEGFDGERSTVLSALALASAKSGADRATVRDLHEQSIAIKERMAAATGNRKALGASIINYANYLLDSGLSEAGDGEQAELQLNRANEIARQIGDPEMQAVVAVNFAELYEARGRPVEAMRLLDRAGELAKQHGIAWVSAEVERMARRLAEAS